MYFDVRAGFSLSCFFRDTSGGDEYTEERGRLKNKQLQISFFDVINFVRFNFIDKIESG